MKATLLQENLKLALNHVQRAISTKPQLPILSSVLITTQPDYIELAATDLYLGVRCKVLGAQAESGAIAVPGKLLMDGINNLPAGNLELESSDNQLQISSKAGKTTFQAQPADEFPPFPEVTGETYTFDTTLLDAIESDVRFAASLDVTRPVLTALNFVWNDQGLEIVATDGFRLAVLKQPSQKIDQPKKLLIPAKAISELVKIAAQEKATQITMILAEQIKQLLFIINDVEVFVRLIEGEFPPYEKIMPTSFAFEASFDGEEFAAQLKRTLVFARESSNIVKLTFTADTLTITSNSTTFGNFTGELPIKLHTGQEGVIAFNGKYVQDFLNSLKPGEIWFGMNESLKPAVFRPEGFTDYTYVVMPFRVND